MTTPRRDGGGTDFGNWLREQPDLDANLYGLAATDIDFMFQGFRTKVDRIGTREVRMKLHLEVKTYGKSPESEFSQLETIFFDHQELYDKRKRLGLLYGKGTVSVWDFGWNFLKLSGSRPVEGSPMWWGIFRSPKKAKGGKLVLSPKDGAIDWIKIDIGTLKEMLKFDRYPDKPDQLITLRRHHKTRVMYAREITPLGFEIEVEVRKSS